MTQHSNGTGNSNSTSSGLHFTETPMAGDQIVTAGQEVARLLNSPQFNLAYQSVVKNLGIELLRTEAHEQKKREALYLEGKVLDRVIWKLRDCVAAAHQITQQEMQMEERNQYEASAKYRQPEQATL